MDGFRTRVGSFPTVMAYIPLTMASLSTALDISPINQQPGTKDLTLESTNPYPFWITAAHRGWAKQSCPFVAWEDTGAGDKLDRLQFGCTIFVHFPKGTILFFSSGLMKKKKKQLFPFSNSEWNLVACRQREWRHFISISVTGNGFVFRSAFIFLLFLFFFYGNRKKKKGYTWKNKNTRVFLYIVSVTHNWADEYNKKRLPVMSE